MGTRPQDSAFPERIKISRSLAKTLRNRDYRFTFDTAFSEVINACATPQPGREETWITEEMKQAYIRLHQLGYAHSAEVREENRLVGGLYGIAIGRVFFGESMFSRARDTSKIALVHLARHLVARNFGLIDCQVYSPHLISLGAEEIERRQFCDLLQHFCNQPGFTGSWTEALDET